MAATEPLIAALRSRRLHAVRVALLADGKLPLARAAVQAAGMAWPEALELLQARGVSLNALYRGYRPLHALIQSDAHSEAGRGTAEGAACLRWLLAHGADPELPGAWPPARAILVAAFQGEPLYVDALREGGARMDGFAAAALGHLAGVKKALARDPAFAHARDHDALTALQCAAASRMGLHDRKTARALLDIVRLLLDHGADPNAKTKSWSHVVDAAYFAARPGNAAMFELLLEHGADATAALPSAAWLKEPELAEIALRHGADPDRAVHDGKPLLNNLVRWGQVKQALWLAGRGASPNVADDRGWTAVHQAASRGNERMVRAMLEAGGDARRVDNEGRTPVDIARAGAFGGGVARR